MDKIKDGGPAFPMSNGALVHTIGCAAIQGVADANERDRIYTEVTAIAAAGMSLRDYFATHTEIDPDLSSAYAKSVVGREIPDYHGDPVGHALFWAEYRARMRYIEADAMLRARGAA
ncbi:hypothetical protein ACTXHA_28725 [Burkholderia cenocepacia]